MPDPARVREFAKAKDRRSDFPAHAGGGAEVQVPAKRLRPGAKPAKPHRPSSSIHAAVSSPEVTGVIREAPVFLGGGARPNARFQELCALAGIRPRMNVETGAEGPWELKDLRKTCATYYDEHLPESSVEILGHSVGGITYRHYAHRAPLAFKAIMTLPQPTAFSALIHGHEGECPCCRRRFADAG